MPVFFFICGGIPYDTLLLFVMLHTTKSKGCKIASIHHIERASLDDEDIEHVDILEFAVGNMDKFRNIASKV